MQDRIKWISAGMVPGLDVVAADWSCLDGLLEKVKLQAERRELARVLAEIGKVPMTRPEVLETHRSSYERARRAYQEGRLAKFISENLTNRDPFKRVVRMEYFAVGFPEWSDLEAAILSLPDQAFGSADERERQAEVKKLRAAIGKIDDRIAALSCPPYLRQDQTGLHDVRELFAEFWHSRQSQCSEAVDAQGFQLRGAPAEVREWYEKLGIGLAVSSNRDALLGALRD